MVNAWDAGVGAEQASRGSAPRKQRVLGIHPCKIVLVHTWVCKELGDRVQRLSVTLLKGKQTCYRTYVYEWVLLKINKGTKPICLLAFEKVICFYLRFDVIRISYDSSP